MTDERHELIHYDTDIPLRFYINRLTGYEDRHWHSSIEILFILSGQLTVSVDNVVYVLYEDDVIVINSDAVHDMKSEACEMILLQIDLEHIYFRPIRTDTYFMCCSVNKQHSYTDYNYIRYLIARIIQTNSISQNNCKTMALIYMLFNELNTSFSENRFLSSGSEKHNDRIRMITRYIKSHYRENITLSSLAESQHMSVSYLSKFIEKHMGTTFINYSNSIKLEHAVNEMLSSDLTIESIARNSGFSDSRSFVNAFKKSYGVRPSEYRKNYSKSISVVPKQVHSTAKWTSISLSDTAKLEKLGKYLNLFQHEIPMTDYKVKSIDCKTIDFTSSLGNLQHNYRKVLTINSAKLLLYASVQEMIMKTQQEIGFEYLSFHGLISDDMMVYGENNAGKPTLSFTQVNEALDFVLSLKLKPFIRLNFMPRALAASSEKYVFFKRELISKPKDMDKWKYLVVELFQNLMNRYGTKEVLTWPVNIWNEPASGIFSFDQEEDFFVFYTETYHIIKNLLPKIKIGTPATTFFDCDWFFRFTNYIEANGCSPDFIDIHYYDDALATQKRIEENPDNKYLVFNNLSEYGILNNLSTDPSSLFIYLNEFKKTMKTAGYTKIPHYLTEWNLTLSSRNPINDTCFKSCYLAKNLLDNYDRLDSFGYWNLTDYFEELQTPSHLFHGGFGLLTMNGIPKSSYNVLRIMKHLGKTFLGRGDGWFATKDEMRISIIYYNYEHFPKLFASGKLLEMTNTEHYIPFFNKQDAVAKIHLCNLPGTRCTVKEFYINREHGSSYDTWVRMGAETLNQEDLSLLQAASAEGLYIHSEEIMDGHLTISSMLEPLEVRLVQIEIAD